MAARLRGFILMLSIALLTMEMVVRFCQIFFHKAQPYSIGFIVYSLLGGLIPYLLVQLHPQKQEWHQHWFYILKATLIPVALQSLFYIFVIEPLTY